MSPRSGRPVDHARRAQLLDRVVEHVLSHGLAELSMRPLARAAGCDQSVLAHHFGNKDELLAAVLIEVRRRLHDVVDQQRDAHGSPRERLLALWGWCAAAEHAALYRLFFEAYGLALQRPDRYALFLETVVDDWLRWLAADADPATATLVVASVRGLLLDLLTTGDRVRTTAAVHRLADGLDVMLGAPGGRGSAD